MNKDLKLVIVFSSIGLFGLIPAVIALNNEKIFALPLVVFHVANIIFCGCLLKRGISSP